MFIAGKPVLGIVLKNKTLVVVISILSLCWINSLILGLSYFALIYVFSLRFNFSYLYYFILFSVVWLLISFTFGHQYFTFLFHSFISNSVLFVIHFIYYSAPVVIYYWSLIFQILGSLTQFFHYMMHVLHFLAANCTIFPFAFPISPFHSLHIIWFVFLASICSNL